MVWTFVGAFGRKKLKVSNSFSRKGPVCSLNAIKVPTREVRFGTHTLYESPVIVISYGKSSEPYCAFVIGTGRK